MWVEEGGRGVFCVDIFCLLGHVIQAHNKVNNLKICNILMSRIVT